MNIAFAVYFISEHQTCTRVVPNQWNTLEYLIWYLTHLHVCYLKLPGLEGKNMKNA